MVSLWGMFLLPHPWFKSSYEQAIKYTSIVHAGNIESFICFLFFYQQFFTFTLAFRLNFLQVLLFKDSPYILFFCFCLCPLFCWSYLLTSFFSIVSSLMTINRTNLSKVRPHFMPSGAQEIYWDNIIEFFYQHWNYYSVQYFSCNSLKR